MISLNKKGRLLLTLVGSLFVLSFFSAGVYKNTTREVVISDINLAATNQANANKSQKKQQKLSPKDIAKLGGPAKKGSVIGNKKKSDTQCNALKKKKDEMEKRAQADKRYIPAAQKARAAYEGYSAHVQGKDTGGSGAECKCAPDEKDPKKGVCKNTGSFDKAKDAAKGGGQQGQGDQQGGGKGGMGDMMKSLSSMLSSLMGGGGGGGGEQPTAEEGKSDDDDIVLDDDFTIPGPAPVSTTTPSTTEPVVPEVVPETVAVEATADDDTTKNERYRGDGYQGDGFTNSYENLQIVARNSIAPDSLAQSPSPAYEAIQDEFALADIDENADGYSSTHQEEEWENLRRLALEQLNGTSSKKVLDDKGLAKNDLRSLQGLGDGSQAVSGDLYPFSVGEPYYEDVQNSGFFASFWVLIKQIFGGK